MKIWKLEFEFGEYESLRLKNQDRTFLREFKNRILSGKEQMDEFKDIKVEVVDGNQHCDFPKFWSASGILICSDQAKNSIEHMLINEVEFIPVRLENRKYYLVNILKVIDCVDYENAVLRSLSTGLVVGFEKYAFEREKIINVHMFKILLNNQIYTTEIYVTNEFKCMIEAAGLSGLRFIEIWEVQE